MYVGESQSSFNRKSRVCWLCCSKILVNGSLTRVNVKFNSMKTEGVTLLRDAVKGRADFVLEDEYND